MNVRSQTRLPAMPSGRRPSAIGRSRGVAYLWATVAVGVAGVIAAAVEKVLPLPNLSLVFLSAVLLVAVRFGTWPALYAAVLGLATYNVFFTVPYFTFNVHHESDVLTLLFFVLVALLTGNLAGRVRSQLDEVRESAARTDVLYDFSRKVADATGTEGVLSAVCRHASATFGARSMVFLSVPESSGGIEAASMHPAGDGPSDDDLAAAQGAWREGRPLGIVSETRADTVYVLAPLRTGHGTLGLMVLALPHESAGLVPEQRRMLTALADQSAVAIEKARLAEDIEKARRLSETESLRAALLSSVSHDLRTPLASIIGSATTLASVWESLTSADRRDLTDTILEESNRLNRLVQNLLDMTRLAYGALEPRRDWVDLREIIGRAIVRMRETLGRHRTVVEIGDGVPFLYLDPVLMEQVFVNIIDNAAKYAPDSSTISVSTALRDGMVDVRVEDEGPGIAPEERDLVFEMFSRMKAADGRTAGTGLGLSICKGFVEAHGGTIAAQEAAGGRGTAIVVSLPMGQPPTADSG